MLFSAIKRLGKVRDIYERNDQLVLITTDRHSSFDRIIAHIPWKGQVLNPGEQLVVRTRQRTLCPIHVLEFLVRT